MYDSLVTGYRDEELVLDVDEMIRFSNALDVGVLYAALGKPTSAPVSNAAADLDAHIALLAPIEMHRKLAAEASAKLPQPSSVRMPC